MTKVTKRGPYSVCYRKNQTAPNISIFMEKTIIKLQKPIKLLVCQYCFVVTGVFLIHPDKFVDNLQVR